MLAEIADLSIDAKGSKWPGFAAYPPILRPNGARSPTAVTAGQGATKARPSPEFVARFIGIKRHGEQP